MRLFVKYQWSRYYKFKGFLALISDKLLSLTRSLITLHWANAKTWWNAVVSVFAQFNIGWLVKKNIWPEIYTYHDECYHRDTEHKHIV